MNKEHWNIVILDGSILNDDILDMINHSHDLVFQKLKKVDREKLENMI